MTRPRLSARARHDLHQIVERIATDNPAAARRWKASVLGRIKSAARMPRSGRRVPERARDNLREVIVGAYRIVYRLRPNGIEVLTVFEGHMQLPDDVAAE